MILLRKGDTGPYVYLTQLAMTRSGEGLVIDGIFGVKTEDAVKRFQKAENLAVDGIVGEKTLNSISKYIKGVKYHTSQNGETLEKIAKAENVDLIKIKIANPKFRSKEKIPASTKIVIPLNYDIAVTDIPYCSLLVKWIVEGLNERYPFIKKILYGKSVLGKDLYCLSIGKGKKQLMINAEHHANEWITTPVVLQFTEEYLKAIIYHSKIDRFDAETLYENTKLFIAPSVNPDGMDLVTGAIPDTSRIYEYCEKMNYKKLPFPSGWKANINGTDLNINYPAKWEKAKEIKYSLGYTKPAPRDFVGEYPLSAPESRALYDLTFRNDFRLTLSYHTQGNTIYWKFDDYNPPYSEKIAEYFSKVSGYSYETTPAESGYAGYKDWFIQKYNRPGYTVEVGKGVNPLPLSQINDIYNSNIGIMAGALSIIADS